MAGNITQSRIDVDRLRSLLSYDQSTGQFLWLASKGTARRGEIAGHKTREGYRQIKIDGRLYMAHRLAWMYAHGELPAVEIDHKNGLRDDNRISNLRLADPNINAQNQRAAQAISLTGFLGVNQRPSDGRFRARIRVGGRNKHLGYFDTAEAAHAAYLAAKRAHHPGCTI